MSATALSWIAPFWKDVSRWCFFRPEDGVLILPPNRVYKLNATGIGLLGHVQRGGSVEEVARGDPGRERDIHAFFDSLRALLAGENAALPTVPFDFAFTSLPVLAEVAVTYRCNNRCAFCYADCDPGKAAMEELGTSGMKRVITTFAREAKVPFFSFTGGEPLMRRDLCSLARHAARLGLKTNLVTNGTLATPALARALYRAGVKTAQVSVEAPDAATHDALTGRKGAFAETVAGIGALAEAGFSVQTNTTITRRNVGAAAAMPAFLRALGVRRFSMNLFIPAGRGASNESLSVRYSEIGPVVDAVRKRAHAEGLTFYWYSPTPFCHYNPVARGLGNKSCAAMDGLLSVRPDGQILPCSSYDEPMGSALGGGFSRAWFGERAAHFKNKRYAPEECSGCDSFGACQAACPLYWKALGTSEIRNPKRSQT